MDQRLPHFLQKILILLPINVCVLTRRWWRNRHWLPRWGAQAVVSCLTLVCCFSLIVPASAQSPGVPPSSADDPAPPMMIVASNEGGSRQLPMVGERLKVAIDQGHASTHFEHAFQNEGRDVLEGHYQIVLGAVSTATGFSYMNGPTKITGEIFEKEAAAQIYATVTGQGRDPGLLEQSGEGQFSFRVAPILPGEVKRVNVQTSQLLSQRGSFIEYNAPLARSGKGSQLSLKDSRKIVKIWSPTHELSIKKSGRLRLVTVGNRKTNGTRLSLRYQVEEKDFHLSTALHQSAGHDAYLMLSVATPDSFRSPSLPRDITIIIDRSGSMSGPPLEAARRTTAGLLKRLSDDDRVNLVFFDDGAESVYPTPQPLSKVRADALKKVEALTTGGGTDLALALTTALGHQSSGERPRYVLFLTDGQSSPQDVLRAADSAPASLRLYTVGIGAGVDRALLSRLAREHRGRFTYVADESRLEQDVDQVFNRIKSPALSDISISIDGAQMTRVYPRKSPDLFESDQLIFALRIRKQESNRVRLVLTAQSNGHKKVLSKQLDLGAVQRPWVGRLWAQKRIDDLLEGISLEGETPELKNEVIDLALAYDLVTRYTSFLAIPESEITSEVRGSIDSERKRRANILAKHKDAAALSRTIMPPGDPQLSVHAPHDAQSVTAVFPFGLTLDLHYEPSNEVWQGRFLVPNQVSDGIYQTQIYVVDREGQLSQTTTEYEIDSVAPAFTHRHTIENDGVRLAVEADEDLREVRVQVLDEKGQMFDTSKEQQALNFKKSSTKHFEKKLTLAPGLYRLRIVVTDLARNESVQEIVVAIQEKAKS